MLMTRSQSGPQACTPTAPYRTTGVTQRAQTENSIPLSDTTGEPCLHDTPGTRDRMALIKAKPHSQRSRADMQCLFCQDNTLAAIYAKEEKRWSSNEIEYVQRSTGLVHTFSTLNEQEKRLYDELITQGEWSAARGLSSIALTRYASTGEVHLPSGLSFDPEKTDVTADSIRSHFRFALIDPSGSNARQLEALAQFLEQADRSTGSKT